MKTRNALAATALILATSFAGISSANVSSGELESNIRSSLSTGTVSVSVNDEGLATLFGNVENRSDENTAKMAALEFPGVTGVRSLVSISD